MDDIMIEDEKKPLDALVGGQEEDSQPDPDETMLLDSGMGRVWQVKLPRFLLDYWSSIDAEGVNLATIRVYDAKPHQPPFIIVQIPSDPSDPNSPLEQYELDMINQDVQNQIVIAERPTVPTVTTPSSSQGSSSQTIPPVNSRARTTIMTGKIKHECNLRPRLSERYRKRVKERTRMAMSPVKQVKYLDEKGMGVGGQGGINRLSSGVASTVGFTDLSKPKQKGVKGQFERMARMPRNQLLDMLFGIFREREFWPIKLLRERLQQPEVYLKEILNDIATLHRSGEHNGHWELKPGFKDSALKGEVSAEAMSLLHLSAKEEADRDAAMAGMEDDNDDEDDEEDEDMEEVS